jgi:chromosomal replication initiation ATPase DnaA
MTEADRLAENANVPHALAELVAILAERYGRTIKQVRGECRDHDLVRIRKAIANEGRQRSFSFHQIGRALNRDHSTIVSHVRGRRPLALDVGASCEIESR